MTASAALEAGVGVSIYTKAVPARGFLPLFRKYASMVTVHIGVDPDRIDELGASSWAARLGAIEDLARTGVDTWLRLDPVIPGRTDGESVLSPLLAAAACAGANGIVARPFVLDDAGTERIASDPTVVDFYRPRFVRKRGVPVPEPRVRLSLERETALAWRVRRVAEPLGLNFRTCCCSTVVPGTCGLVPLLSSPPRDATEAQTPVVLARQHALWAG